MAWHWRPHPRSLLVDFPVRPGPSLAVQHKVVVAALAAHHVAVLVALAALEAVVSLALRDYSRLVPQLQAHHLSLRRRRGVSAEHRGAATKDRGG